MNEWIEINLPFKKYIYNDDYNNDPCPNISKEMKSVFGKSKEEHYKEISFELSNSVKDLIEDKSKEEIEVLRETNPLVEKVLAHNKITKKMNDWFNEHPSIIAWCNRADQRNADRKELEKKISFCGANLNKAGTLIEVEEDGKLNQYLIGDINALGGLCDDCSISNDAIVKRYKIVYEKE